MRPPSPGKSSRERSRGPEEGGGTDVGLSIPASEKVRVAAEKEMPEEVGKKEDVGGGGSVSVIEFPEYLLQGCHFYYLSLSYKIRTF